MQKRALCVWLPAWPLERVAAARAELNGSALLLYEQSHGGLRVVAYATAGLAISWRADCPRDADPLAAPQLAPSSLLKECQAGISGVPPAISGVPRALPVRETPGGSDTGRARGTQRSDENLLIQQAAGRTSGIRPGMPLAEAVALHEYAVSLQKTPGRKAPGRRGPSEFTAKTAQKTTAQKTTAKNWDSRRLHIEAHDPVADRLALEQLAQEMAAFSPLVSLEDAPRPDSLLLDVTGLAALFGGEERLARQAAQALAARGLTARVAIADTRGAAWGLAHYGSGSPLALPVREQVGGSDTGRASGALSRSAGELTADRSTDDRLSSWLVSPSGEARLALAPLPLAALRLSAATIETLGELGVRRIGSLLHLPRGAVASRFGAETLRRLDEALGAAADVAPAEKPAEPLTAERLFEFPTDRRELVEATLEQLLNELIAPLARERKGLLRLACRLGRVGLASVEFEVSLFRPTAAPRHVLELVRLRLDALVNKGVRNRFNGRFQETVPDTFIQIESARITVTAAAPLRLEQQGLFGEQSPRESPRRLAALVDRLASRLGRQAVVRPTLLADVQPEYACQYLPLDAEAPAGDSRSRSHRSSKRRARTNRSQKGRQPARKKSSPSAAAPDASALFGVEAPTTEVTETVFRRPAFLPGERPLRLLATPEPLAATSIAAEGPPARFEFGGQGERIVRVWGPERIETGWWRGRCLRRDYYRVETATGSHFWLFRRLADGRWFLHGEFE